MVDRRNKTPLMKPDDIDKEIYRSNRDDRLRHFRGCLAEPKNPFAVQAAIDSIRTQEEFMARIQTKGHRLTTYKEEKKVLDAMVAEATKVLGVAKLKSKT